MIQPKKIRNNALTAVILLLYRHQKKAQRKAAYNRKYIGNPGSSTDAVINYKIFAKNPPACKMKTGIRRLFVMETIHVAIAEDHKIFRKGIILSMQPYPNIRFVMQAGDGQELIDQLPGETPPEVILMDIRMPVMDGIATTKYLAAHYPGIHIICLTMFEDQQFVNEMMASGACAYLLKNSEPREINAAIMEVMARGYHHSTVSNGVLFKQSANKNNPGN